MAVEFSEKFESRRVDQGTDPRAELLYDLIGETNDQSARILANSSVPLAFDVFGDGSLVLWRDRVIPEAVGPDHWLVRAFFSRRQGAMPADGRSFSFDTTGGTAHITHSIQTVDKAATMGSTAPDNQGAIGVTKDGVEGTDIVVPTYSWSDVYVFPASQVTGAYKAKLFYATGKVNDATFQGLAAGECLFRGAVGASRPDGNVEITFSFSASPNQTNITVGNLQPVDKKGWEYLWIRFGDFESNNEIVKRPIAVYVEKVYDLADFSELGIGTD